MRERPILFSAAMVRAISAGTKTQTRRPVKPQPELYGEPDSWWHPATEGEPQWGAHLSDAIKWACPYGQPGDRLWVRETFQHLGGAHMYRGERYNVVRYLADDIERRIDEPEGEDHSLTLHYLINKVPSIHMPRWACRLVLEIVSVRVERVQEISEADALAEGVSLAWYSREHDIDGFYESYREAFQDAWNHIYAAKGQGWEANPWVWVVEFKRAEASA